MSLQFIKVSTQIYPSNSFDSVKKRLKFIATALPNMQLLEDFTEKIISLKYAHVLDHEISVLGAIEWPYIHNNWDVTKRFQTIASHYEFLKSQAYILDVTHGSGKKLLDLSAYSPKVSVILDKPQWFAREGEIVLNIFKDDLRCMSIAFTFAKVDNELLIYVGAIQGAPANNEIPLILKELTKDFEGLRPRSFVIEILGMLARKLGVKEILAISDEHRHRFHPYFSNYKNNYLKANYDEIWKDNGGILLENGFFRMPIHNARREFSEIPSNKRSMYRKRYEMLDQVESQLIEKLS